MNKKPSTAGAKVVLNIEKMTGDIKNKVKIKGKDDNSSKVKIK